MRILATLLTVGIGATPLHAADSKHAAELIKTPDCTCCEGYADHLRAAGFDVTVKATLDLAGMTAAVGVPPGA